jgi:hypothetical protein
MIRYNRFVKVPFNYYGRIRADSPADFVPCFVAFETNVRDYALAMCVTLYMPVRYVFAKECR